jgi:hypothetical protein
MFYMFYSLNYKIYNIIKFKKDITKKASLVVLHGLATADGTDVVYRFRGLPRIALRKVLRLPRPRERSCPRR